MRLPILPDVPLRAPGPRPVSFSLRVSVLDACNLRCGYCAPGALGAPTQRPRLLTPSEHATLAPLLRDAGVRKVRFTGGEPLLRKELAAIIAAWRAAMPDAELALTTNGTHLLEQARALRDAGLGRVTLHLDTLRRDRYPALMGAGSPEQVLEALAVSQRLFDEVKLNVVVQRGRNDDELEAFLALSKRTGAEVRFIEIMSTGSADAFARDAFVAGREIVARVNGQPVERRDPADPAALFVAPNGVRFGLIASDTEPFCSACDRLRLTADGRLRGCLYEAGGVPLGDALRSGENPDALAALMRGAIAGKRSWHPATDAERVPFSMADVGG